MEIRYSLAVVTGAGGGLGRELAVALARRGVAVLAADRDLAAAEETVGLVREHRVSGWAFGCDVTEESDLRALAGRARDLGGADVLVNNAGGWTDDWWRTLDLNLRAPVLLTHLFLDDLDRRRGARPVGAVVNVSSSAALGAEGYGCPEYAAAKAGLIRFTTALADPETAARARVMTVVPGWIGLPRAQEQWAELTDDERAAQGPLIPPAEVTRAVVDLVAHGRAGQVVELL